MTTIDANVNLRPRTATTLRAGDAGYDAARTVWNAMVDHRPELIVRCAGVTDVVAAVRLARERDLEIGVKCGGHSSVGHAVPDGGLMVDLTPMNRVVVDPVTRRALVQGGAMLRSLDHEAQKHGLATTAGNVSHTGVGGLTLGGGMGWLARKYGLARDNVCSFEVVTADGDTVRASAQENPDLFWGLRGGGGNFGIVTDFEFQLHPVGTRALAAEYEFSIEDAAAALRVWRDLAATAPREATFNASIGADQIATMGFVWVGDPRKARPLVAAMRDLGRPLSERIAAQSYVALQRREDASGGHAYRRYGKGHYLRELSAEAVDAFVGRGAGSDDARLLPGVGLQAHGGAIGDVAGDSSAFSHRDAAFEYGAGTRWTDTDEDAAPIEAARRCAAAMEPFASGVYVNALGDEGAEGVRRAYTPDRLARLTALKDRYDPSNVFHLNHNITPSGR